MTSTGTRANLRRRLLALLLGRSDMAMVASGATYWRGEHPDSPAGHDAEVPFMARRCFEAGVIVSYCRPFTTSVGLQSLGRASGLSDALRAAHDGFMEQRDVMYAHTDATDHRYTAAVDEWVVGDRQVGPVEFWTPPSREDMSALVQLATVHYDRWTAEAHVVADKLAALA